MIIHANSQVIREETNYSFWVMSLSSPMATFCGQDASNNEISSFKERERENESRETTLTHKPNPWRKTEGKIPPPLRIRGHGGIASRCELTERRPICPVSSTQHLHLHRSIHEQLNICVCLFIRDIFMIISLTLFSRVLEGLLFTVRVCGWILPIEQLSRRWLVLFPLASSPSNMCPSSNSSWTGW